MLTRRLPLPIGFLIAAAILGCVAAFCINDVAWQTAAIGIASSFGTAGLVDFVAVTDSYRRDQAILKAAGYRVARVHQRLVTIISEVCGVSGEASTLVQQLRALDTYAFDMSQQAKVFPPRTQGEWVRIRSPSSTRTLTSRSVLGS